MSAPQDRRPSAALLLGVLAGLVAGIAVLPTAVPLIRIIHDADIEFALRHVDRAGAATLRMLDEQGRPPAGTAQSFGLDHLWVTDSGGRTLARADGGLDDATARRACDEVGSAHALVDATGNEWAVSCRTGDGQRVIAALRPSPQATGRILYWVMTLSVIVGIVTSLATLRLLQPLARVSQALELVRAGVRGVRVPTTGLGELDELVSRLNAASQAMDDRQDAILARFQVVQELARIVAHEVRNPLQSLELLTSLIAAEEGAEERAELAMAIHSEIRALDKVVTRLLREGARGGAIRLRRSRRSLVPIVENVLTVRTFEARAKGIKLDKGEFADAPAYIDSALVARAVENLVANAMTAVPAGTGVVRVSIVELGQELAVVVEDNGSGVPESIRDAMFDPDVTTRPEGTGLGLTLVKGVLEAHGGSIEYDRSPLGGARFTCRLPAQEDTVDRTFTPRPGRRRQSLGG